MAKKKKKATAIAFEKPQPKPKHEAPVIDGVARIDKDTLAGIRGTSKLYAAILPHLREQGIDPSKGLLVYGLEPESRLVIIEQAPSRKPEIHERPAMPDPV
jgi:hypothetical protein